MSILITQTTVLPPSKQNVRPTLLVMNITSGSVAIQYPCGSNWVNVEPAYTVSGVKAIENFGVPVRILITGTVECEYTDSTTDK